MAPAIHESVLNCWTEAKDPLSLGPTFQRGKYPVANPNSGIGGLDGRLQK